MNDTISSESVVLLHGLGANRWAMWRLANRLHRTGYATQNWGYSTVSRPVAETARQIFERFQRYLEQTSYTRVHLVTHSMGSIVARWALQQLGGSPGRIVMLGPPNGGSHVARKLADSLGRFCPPLYDLSDSPESYVNRLGPPPESEIGIIAAARDRVVRLASTQLAGQKDHIVLPGHHGTLPWRTDVGDQVVHFLHHGEFRHG